MALVKGQPFSKTAAGKRQARKLTALASIVESEAQLDIILSTDLRLRHDPRLRESVKAEILRLNPKLKEIAHGGQ